MKKILATVALASILIAGAAYAGSLSDPVVAPEVVMADTVESASKIEGILAALTVITIILGAAGAFCGQARRIFGRQVPGRFGAVFGVLHGQTFTPETQAPAP